MFARVENGVTNCAKNFAGKTVKTAQFWPDFFHFSQQDRFLFARVEIGVTEFPTKIEQEQGGKCLGYFSKVGAHPLKMSVWREKTSVFLEGGGVITSNLAS